MVETRNRTSLLPMWRNSFIFATPKTLSGPAAAKQIACKRVVFPAPLIPSDHIKLGGNDGLSH